MFFKSPFYCVGKLSGVRLNIISYLLTLNNKTMIFYLLIFYLLSESMAATNSTNDSTSYDVSNKIACYYQGNLNNDSDPSSFIVDVQYIPCECDSILYASFYVNQSSMIDVDEKLLKSVTNLKKPVIVALRRTELYSGWSAILSEKGNANETKMLCDFAIKFNIQGYEIWTINPSDGEAVDRNVTKNIIPYIKQLKEFCPLLIIGAALNPYPKYLKNKDVYNLKELNEVLTYFIVDALQLNGCNPILYNGLTPITSNKTGDNHLYGLEDVVSNLKETGICFNKITITIPLLIKEIMNNTFPSYSDMCKGEFDNSSMCVQTSQNYFEKGNYLSKQKLGITVEGVEWDDSSNACNCTLKFNGFHNIYAGYRNCTVIPCSKFDVQSTVYPIK